MNRFTRFFLSPSAGGPLAFFRIGIAMIGLIQGCWLLGNVVMLYGVDGLVPWSLSKGIVSSMMPQLSWLQPLGNGDVWVYVLMAVYLVCLLFLLIGMFTPVVAFVAWGLHLMFINTGFMAAYGVETFLHISLFYCILMPVGESYSWRNGKQSVSEWNTLALRVLQIHLCIVYFSSGVEKAMGAQWWNGEAVWQTLMQGQFARFDMRWLADYPFIAKLLCWSTLLIEMGYPFFIWWRRTRVYAYVAVVLLHVGISIFMGLQLFAGIMIVLNTAAFGWQYIGQVYMGLMRPVRVRRVLRRAEVLATGAFWSLE
jgi:hypothetical protein